MFHGNCSAPETLQNSSISEDHCVKDRSPNLEESRDSAQPLENSEPKSDLKQDDCVVESARFGHGEVKKSPSSISLQIEDVFDILQESPDNRSNVEKEEIHPKPTFTLISSIRNGSCQIDADKKGRSDKRVRFDLSVEICGDMSEYESEASIAIGDIFSSLNQTPSLESHDSLPHEANSAPETLQDSSISDDYWIKDSMSTLEESNDSVQLLENYDPKSNLKEDDCGVESPSFGHGEVKKSPSSTSLQIEDVFDILKEPSDNCNNVEKEEVSPKAANLYTESRKASFQSNDKSSDKHVRFVLNVKSNDVVNECVDEASIGIEDIFPSLAPLTITDTCETPTSTMNCTADVSVPNEDSHGNPEEPLSSSFSEDLWLRESGSSLGTSQDSLQDEVPHKKVDITSETLCDKKNSENNHKNNNDFAANQIPISTKGAPQTVNFDIGNQSHNNCNSPTGKSNKCICPDDSSNSSGSCHESFWMEDSDDSQSSEQEKSDHSYSNNNLDNDSSGRISTVCHYLNTTGTSSDKISDHVGIVIEHSFKQDGILPEDKDTKQSETTTYDINPNQEHTGLPVGRSSKIDNSESIINVHKDSKERIGENMDPTIVGISLIRDIFPNSTPYQGSITQQDGFSSSNQSRASTERRDISRLKQQDDDDDDDETDTVELSDKDQNQSERVTNSREESWITCDSLSTEQTSEGTSIQQKEFIHSKNSSESNGSEDIDEIRKDNGGHEPKSSLLVRWGQKQDDPDYHDSCSDSSDGESHRSREENDSELPGNSNNPPSNQDNKNDEENCLKSSLLVHWGPKCDSSESEEIVHDDDGLLADWGSSSNSFLPWDATSKVQEKVDNNTDVTRDESHPNVADSPPPNKSKQNDEEFAEGPKNTWFNGGLGKFLGWTKPPSDENIKRADMGDPIKDDEESGSLAVFWNKPEEDEYQKDHDTNICDNIRESDQNSGFETVSSHSSTPGIAIKECGESHFDEKDNSFLPWSSNNNDTALDSDITKANENKDDSNCREQSNEVLETRNVIESVSNSEPTELNTLSDSEAIENNSIKRNDSSLMSANVSIDEMNLSVSKGDQIIHDTSLETDNDLLDIGIYQNVDIDKVPNSKNPEIKETDNKTNHATMNDDGEKGIASGEECQSNSNVAHEKESVRSLDNGNRSIDNLSHSSMLPSHQQNKDELFENLNLPINNDLSKSEKADSGLEKQSNLCDESEIENEPYFEAGNAHQSNDIELTDETPPDPPLKEEDLETKTDENQGNNEYTPQNDFGIGKASKWDWMAPVASFDELTQHSENDSENVSTLYEDSFSTLHTKKREVDKKIPNQDRSGNHSSTGNIDTPASCHGSDEIDETRTSDQSEKGIEYTKNDLNEISKDPVNEKCADHVSEPITIHMEPVISDSSTDEIDEGEISSKIDDFDIKGKSHSGLNQSGDEAASINSQDSLSLSKDVESNCQIPELDTEHEGPEINPKTNGSNLENKNESQIVESDKDDISKKLSNSDSDCSGFVTSDGTDLQSDKNHLKMGSSDEQGDLSDSGQPHFDLHQADSVSINSERSHSVQSIFAMSDKSESSGDEKDIAADSRMDPVSGKHGQTRTVNSDSSSMSINSDYDQSSSDQSSFAMSEISELIADREDDTINSETKKAEKETHAQEKIPPGENGSDSMSSESNQSNSAMSEMSGLIPKKRDIGTSSKGDDLNVPPQDKSINAPNENDSISADSKDSLSSSKEMVQSDEESQNYRISKKDSSKNMDEDQSNEIEESDLPVQEENRHCELKDDKVPEEVISPSTNRNEDTMFVPLLDSDDENELEEGLNKAQSAEKGNSGDSESKKENLHKKFSIYPNTLRKQKLYTLSFIILMVAVMSTAIGLMAPSESESILEDDTMSSNSPSSSPSKQPSNPFSPQPNIEESPNFMNSTNVFKVYDSVKGLSGSKAGFAICLSNDGTRLAVGAPHDSLISRSQNAGIVRIYDLLVTSENGEESWDLVKEIPGNQTNDKFGYSISFSNNGNVIAIGAPGHNNDMGTVRVYDLSSQWTLLHELFGSEKGDFFGSSVSMSADGFRVAVGSPRHKLRSGMVEVFEGFNSSTQATVGMKIVGKSNEIFGASVLLSHDGTQLFVGAPHQWQNQSGYVASYLYDSVDNGWISETANLNLNITGDKFGQSLSLSADGTRLAIGSPGSNDVLGSTTIFSKNENGKWSSWGERANGKHTDDQFGHSIALSSDGNFLIAGSLGRKNKNGDIVGSVRLFNLSKPEWHVASSEIFGKINEDFGASVAISRNGTWASASAPRQDLVRIFRGQI